ncbi:hypothetical protein KTE51_29970, partial [Burkholderia multivorans]|nr:hypothetical protein [Burkholderia multivorans]
CPKFVINDWLTHLLGPSVTMAKVNRMLKKLTALGLFLKPSLKESARIEKKPAQGVEAHWNPVAVASWLHTVRKRRLRELDEIFLKKQDLEAWRSDWEKESDRLRNRSGFIG